MSVELSLLVLVFDVVFVVVADADAVLNFFCAITLACFGAQFHVTRFTF